MKRVRLNLTLKFWFKCNKLKLIELKIFINLKLSQELIASY